MVETEERKLPVFKTVGRAYWFLFKNFFEILRVSWFGVLIYVALFGLAFFAVSFYAQFSSLNPFSENRTVILFAAWIGAVFLIQIMLVMAIMRVFFDRPRGSGFIYLRFGVPEARFIAFDMIWLLIVAAIMTVYFLTYWGLTLILPPALSYFILLFDNVIILIQQSAAMVAILSILYVITAIVLAVALMAPLIIIGMRFAIAQSTIMAEDKIGLMRTWRLTQGNFWRLLGAYILAWIPLLGFEALQRAFLPMEFEKKILSIPPGNLDMLRALVTPTDIVELIGVAFVSYLTLWAVMGGVSGAAYRALAAPVNE